MTDERLRLVVDAAEREQDAVAAVGGLLHRDDIETLVSDVRDVRLTGGQILVLREIQEALELQGFRLYPAFLATIIRRWDEAAA